MSRTAHVIPELRVKGVVSVVAMLVWSSVTSWTRSLSRSMSREGRPFAQRCYDWRENAPRVEALDADLLSRNSAPVGG